jgi:hypothetical protein
LDGSESTPHALSDPENMLLYDTIRPVCGWLVCLDGVRQGLDYPLYSGLNHIGRAADNDISLFGDITVSRHNHAAVSYDPKKRRFTLLPGAGESIIYLGEEAIYQPTPLYDLSVLTVGQTKLLFRPLCGDNFSWEVD